MARTKNIAFVMAITLAACSRGPRAVTVGSKNFTEQIVLGEIVAQHIERRTGEKVTRQLNLGGTMLAHEAVRKGDIDVYPEYTGTALQAVLKQPGQQDAKAVFEQVRSAYREKFGMDLLAPLGFDNSFAIVVRSSEGQKLGITRLSEANRKAEGWKLGAGYEFETRSDGLPALDRTYGIKWNGRPATMDLGLLYGALEKGQIDMAAANGTDGRLASAEWLVLVDDKHAFPPYEAALVIRVALATERPKVYAALGELSGKIDAATMRRLNAEVELQKKSVAEVASHFLDSSLRAANSYH